MPEISLQNVVAKGGSQRQLSDAIFYIEKDRTPVLSIIPKAGRQDNPNLRDEWPANTKLEGKNNFTGESDLAAEEIDNFLDGYGVLANIIGYARRGFKVGRRAQRTQNLAGINPKRLYAEALTRCIAAVKKDREMWLTSDQEVVAGNGTPESPNKPRAIGAWIASTSSAQPEAYKVPAQHLVPSGHIYSGALSSLTFTGASSSLNAVLGAMFDTTKDKVTRFVPCGRGFKENVAQYTNNQTVPSNTAYVRQYQSTDLERVALMVNHIETDNGSLDLMQVPFIAEWQADGTAQSTAAVKQNRAYILDLQTWELADTLPFSTVPKEQLPQNLSGDLGAVEYEGTLRCYAPGANGAIKCTS